MGKPDARTPEDIGQLHGCKSEVAVGMIQIVNMAEVRKPSCPTMMTGACEEKKLCGS